MTDDFRQRLSEFALRAVDIAPNCNNEESTKLFLILPFVAFLGYDDRNPKEVCPEHAADFSEKYRNRVDFAILKDTLPIIAIECKCAGTPLKDERGQLRAYFNAAGSVKMGVLTDGLLYEFYADSDEPNMMDASAFLKLDLRDVANGKIEESVLDGLRVLQKSAFDPENIGAEAKRKLVHRSMLEQLISLSENPSESFTRLLLQIIGINHVRSRALTEYQAIARLAFRDLINQRILQRLDLATNEAEKIPAVSDVMLSEANKIDEKIVTTEIEYDVFSYVKQRLAFLMKDEGAFRELSEIEYRDYQGKFVVYYKKERKGRLFEFVEDKNSRHQFTFSGNGAIIETNNWSDIDEHLVAIFTQRLKEEGILPSVMY